MTVSEKLTIFYKENNLSEEGGVNEDFFNLKFKLFTVKLPNSQFRKNVVHIHDIQHILYDCDISWKGEAFIAGWEIATGLWKHIPIGFMSLWAMGFSLLTHPKEVWKGYNTGLSVKGIIDLKMTKDELLKLSLEDLKNIIKKRKPTKMNIFQRVIYSFWVTSSLITLFFPFLLILILYLIF